MTKFLPFIFLISIASIFGLSWIIVRVDPETAPFYIFGFFVIFLFCAIWGLLGTFLYFARTRRFKRYSPPWYFATSFKMAFFVALFIALSAILAILGLVTTLNVFLAIAALGLIATWSYLGKREKS